MDQSKINQLVILAQKRDSAAFAELIGHTQRFAFSTVFRIIGNTEESRDVVQEAYIRVWNDLAISLQVYKTPSSAQDLQRIKILLESRFRLEKTNELTLIHLFHSSIILKLNALTIKNLIK